MIPELKDIHYVFEKLIDDGVQYAAIQLKAFPCRRRLKWEPGRHREEMDLPFEIWVLRVLVAGHWGVVECSSFEELQVACSQAMEMARSAHRFVGYSKTTQDVLDPKPIRQMRFNPSEQVALQDIEEVMADIRRIAQLFDAPIGAQEEDEHVQSYFWDSEHSRGACEYLNRKLSIVEHGTGDVESEIQLHHVRSLPEKSEDRYGELWHKELKRWANTLSLEPYTGPSPEDFYWIFSHRAFAQLVQQTLGPSLCLQRPDPFVETMNPSTLNDKSIAPEGFTLFSQPSLFSSGSFLDEEGVPVRQLPLVESGVISNFLMTRSSAHHLSRSLPVHKERYLAGSGRICRDRLLCVPDLKYAEVSTGESLGKDFRLSHLFINDLEIEALDGAQFDFLITAKNVLVNKFSGMHKRHIRRLQFHVNRDALWQQLLGVGQEAISVSLPSSQAFRGEPYSIFCVPMAKFRGFPCVWF